MSFDWLKRLFSNPTHHGSAGWQDAPAAFRCRKEDPITGGGFFLSEMGRYRVVLPRIEALRHGLVVGGSGSGKSRGFICPNAAWAVGTSLVCTDPKSELWNLTSGHRERAVRYAPAEPENSECFNWIPLCSSARYAAICARAIVESGNTSSTDQAWLDTESAFLAGIFAHASTLTEPTPLSAYRLFTRQSIDSLISVLLNSSSESARSEAMIFSQTQERMRGSIVPVVAAKMDWLMDSSVARFTSASVKAPDFSNLRVTPSALYWCLRESDISRLKPLTALFFTILLEQLASKGEDGQGVAVTLLLDEFANIGVLPDFATTIAIARGRGVSLWLGIQALSQLEAVYGKANAQTIISNCGTKIALSGLDVDSAEYFSRALGDETASVAKRTRHGLFNASFSHTKDEHTRRLMTPDEIRRLDSNEFIAIVGNQRPMRLTKYFYSSAPKQKAATASLGKARSIEVSEPQREPPPLPDFRETPRRRRAKPPLSPAKTARVCASSKARVKAI